MLVIGGGIGGLAAALACARAGVAVQLFERAGEFTEVGAGVQLGPNVVKLLEAWGLRDALAAVAAFPDRLQVRSAITGAQLGGLRLGERAVQHYGARYATIHRADLQTLLLAGVRQEPGVQLHLASEFDRFEQDDAGVTAHMTDGRALQADLLLGADGGEGVAAAARGVGGARGGQEGRGGSGCGFGDRDGCCGGGCDRGCCCDCRRLFWDAEAARGCGKGRRDSVGQRRRRRRRRRWRRGSDGSGLKEEKNDFFCF